MPPADIRRHDRVNHGSPSEVDVERMRIHGEGWRTVPRVDGSGSLPDPLTTALHIAPTDDTLSEVLTIVLPAGYFDNGGSGVFKITDENGVVLFSTDNTGHVALRAPSAQIAQLTLNDVDSDGSFSADSHGQVQGQFLCPGTARRNALILWPGADGSAGRTSDHAERPASHRRTCQPRAGRPARLT